jgi:hemolysin D
MKFIPKFADARASLIRTNDELAFLPAALEIVEAPAPPLAGALSYTIIALFCISLVWASFGRVDVIASATGKIVPSGGVKVIQPFQTEVVRAIHVVDGQIVKAGETLIELDPTIDNAERKHIASDLVTARLDVARLTAALGKSLQPAASFQAPPEATGAQIAAQRAWLEHQLAEHRAKLNVLDDQKAQKQAELDTINANVDKLSAILPIIQQRLDIKQVLYSREAGSKVNYLEMLQGFVEAQHELLVQKSRIHEAEAALGAITQTRNQADAEFERTLSSDLVEAQRKVAGLTEDLIKAEQHAQLQFLKSPVDGTVQQLSVHTIGGIVTPAQALLVIVPASSKLEIEANVSNQDIGFVHVGQQAAIKVDTFNFTKYGLLHGHVTNLSKDAVLHDVPNNGTDPDRSSQSEKSEPKGKDLVYTATVALDHTSMQVDENLVDLMPGMAVTVEIKTGSRRIISYLLSPLTRRSQEAMRER